MESHLVHILKKYRRFEDTFYLRLQGWENYFQVRWGTWRLATGWTVRGSNPGGSEIFCTCPNRPLADPASYTMGTESLPGLKWPGRGV